MKYRWLVALAATTLVVGSLLAQAPQVGLVLGVQGSGELQRQGESHGLRMADALFAGDQLEVKTGSASFLFCPSGQLVTVSQGTRIRFQESDFNVEKGPRPSTQGGRKCTLPKVALGAESLERVGGLRARGFPPITVFVGGQLSQLRPTFEWEPVADAERYQILIKDSQGRVIQQGSVTGSSWRPEEELSEGSYQWEIQGYQGKETVGRQLARFVIKPADVGTAAGDDSSDLLLQATQLENEGYYSEAASYYRRLREMFPQDERLTRRLVWLYWNSGLIAAANEENQKLENGSRER